MWVLSIFESTWVTVSVIHLVSFSIKFFWNDPYQKYIIWFDSIYWSFSVFLFLSLCKFLSNFFKIWDTYFLENVVFFNSVWFFYNFEYVRSAMSLFVTKFGYLPPSPPFGHIYIEWLLIREVTFQSTMRLCHSTLFKSSRQNNYSSSSIHAFL